MLSNAKTAKQSEQQQVKLLATVKSDSLMLENNLVELSTSKHCQLCAHA